MRPRTSVQEFTRLRQRACLCVGLLAACLSARAQDADLQLTARAKADQYLVGEPVVLALAVLNAGPTTVKYWPMELETGYLAFSVKTGAQPFRALRVAVVRDPAGSPADLPPGGRYAADAMVHFDFGTRALSLDRPGRFVIRAEYRGIVGREQRPLTAEVTVDVSPVPPAEAAGSELFSRQETAEFLVNVSRAPGIVSAFRTFAARPASRFTPYATYWLARHEMRQYADKRPNVAEAERLFSASNLPTFQFRPSVLLGLIETNQALGRSLDANRYLQTLEAEDGPTGVLNRARRVTAQGAAIAPPGATSSAPNPVPLSAAADADVRDTLNRYFAAFAARDATNCLALLAPNFRYNDVVQKSAMSQHLNEEFAKLAQLGGRPPVRATIARLESVNGAVQAEVALDFINAAGASVGSRRFEIGLLQTPQGWRLSAMKPAR